LRTLASLAFAAAWLAAAAAMAAPTSAGIPSAGIPMIGDEPSPQVVTVSYRCGPHFHYVHGHHARDGAWIRGHCAPDRR